MSTLQIKNAKVVLPDSIKETDVLVENGKIVAIGATKSANRTIDASGCYIMPGFIDIHVHGGGGADFMDDTPEAFDNIVCYGDWLDRSLSNLITIETVGSDAPAIKELHN